MQFSPPVFHSGSANVFSRVDLDRRDRSDAFFWLFTVSFSSTKTLFYAFVYLNFIFLYILLYIETPCTILILQKRYTYGTFSAGRVYMPTQEKKTLTILENIRKCPNPIEWYPNPLLHYQNKNFVSTSKNLRKTEVNPPSPPRSAPPPTTTPASPISATNDCSYQGSTKW